MDWQLAGVILTALALMMAWMNRKFDNIDNHVLEAHKRIDAANARIDQTQSIIMRILEKQGK